VVRILVVDDSGVIRALIRGALEFHARGQDIELLEAGDGARALYVIENTALDLVVLDWAMPKMDGIELVRRVRAVGNDVPMVMVTANADDAQRAIAMEAGVSAYLVKPFRMAELFAAVSPWVLSRVSRV
jgi:CheY-like chemotaxis protein